MSLAEEAPWGVRGTTQYGEDFECPMISSITDELWQGGCANRCPLPPSVVHVVSLAPRESYYYHENVRSVLAVAMNDSDEDIDTDRLEHIVNWVNYVRRDCQENGGIVLVHCQAGLNRSGLVTGLALVRNRDVADGVVAINMLRAKRSPAVLHNKTFADHLAQCRGLN